MNQEAVIITSQPAMSEQEFNLFRAWLFDRAGISISPIKKPMVSGRLMKRLGHYHLGSFSAYFNMLKNDQPPGEAQIALDLLTTNETYFFREPQHFDFLRDQILPQHSASEPFRVWSAACSSGEEPYTIAMVLADRLGEGPWEILASDVSTRILEKARSGHYAMERTEHIPRNYLTHYCLRGVGSQDGTFLISRELRKHVQFTQINLNQKLPSVGKFDVIFLRNVMIYFNNDTKREVVTRLLDVLKPGGYLLIGHSETLHGLNIDIRMVRPSTYQKS